jgi:hypothetical protein
MKLLTAVLVALIAPSTAAAALEVKLAVVPGSPKAGAQVVVELRPFSTELRADGTCCRLVPIDVNYPFKVEAVAASGRVARVRVHKSSPYVWSGSFVFGMGGRWVVRAPQWGPRYSRNYGARPRIAFTVRRRGCEPSVLAASSASPHWGQTPSREGNVVSTSRTGPSRRTKGFGD